MYRNHFQIFPFIALQTLHHAAGGLQRNRWLNHAGLRITLQALQGGPPPLYTYLGFKPKRGAPNVDLS